MEDFSFNLFYWLWIVVIIILFLVLKSPLFLFKPTAGRCVYERERDRDFLEESRISLNSALLSEKKISPHLLLMFSHQNKNRIYLFFNLCFVCKNALMAENAFKAVDIRL